MDVAVLGTGTVGRTISGKVADLGHAVAMGTRDVAGLQSRGDDGFDAWHAVHDSVRLMSFEDAARHGEVVFNATSGGVSLAVLEQAGHDNLAGKVLLDLSNPLDFSQGMPPFLSVCNTDSVAEQIQRALPATRVVKTLNTMTAALMVDPLQLEGGDHHVFVSGDDADAKATATRILTEWFGWRHVIDLGDITSARGAEMWLPLWLRLMGAQQTAMFNIKVVRELRE